MHTISRRSAFACFELLPAIAIVAIIATVLFPVFSHARQRARQVSCLSKEKQIGLGLRMYMQDYDETQPRRQNEATLTSWRHDIRPYVNDAYAFTCPSNPNHRLLSRDNPTTAHDDSDITISYGLNDNDANGVGGACNRHPEGVKLADIASPEQVIGIAESTAYYSDFFVTARVEAESGAFHTTNTTGWNGHLFAGHNSRSNFWFMDGHVKSMRPLDTMNTDDPGNSQAPRTPYNLWTIDNSVFTDQDHSLSPSATPFTFAHANLSYSESVDQ